MRCPTFSSVFISVHLWPIHFCLVVLHVGLPIGDGRPHTMEMSQDVDEGLATGQRRIEEWNLALELVDIEWTLDRQKLVLYVLGGRGAETTKLALQAAAAGLAVVEVQPVNADGPVPLATSGG